MLPALPRQAREARLTPGLAQARGGESSGDNVKDGFLEEAGGAGLGMWRHVQKGLKQIVPLARGARGAWTLEDERRELSDYLKLVDSQL